MFLATAADSQTAASWGKGKRKSAKLQTLTLSPLLGGSSLGGPLGARRFLVIGDEIGVFESEILGSPGSFQKLGGVWLPPNDTPKLSPK